MEREMNKKTLRINLIHKISNHWPQLTAIFTSLNMTHDDSKKDSPNAKSMCFSPRVCGKKYLVWKYSALLFYNAINDQSICSCVLRFLSTWL